MIIPIRLNSDDSEDEKDEKLVHSEGISESKMDVDHTSEEINQKAQTTTSSSSSSLPITNSIFIESTNDKRDLRKIFYHLRKKN